MNATNEGPDAGQHLGELAELHALGALEPRERAQVEAHVASCATCTRALGAAEAMVAALDDAFVPQLEPPDRLGSRIAASAQVVVPLAPRRAPRRAAWPAPSFYATAAALLLAVGVGGGALVEHSADVRQAAHDSAVLATIATSHFNHATLTAHESSAPVSKVLYARDGAWFYVVVDSATCNCRVVAHSAAGERDLGKPEVRGSTATLFARDFPRPTSLELVDGSGRVVSSATLPYPAL
jgi:anti-sigma-K factor RskA